MSGSERPLATRRGFIGASLAVGGGALVGPPAFAFPAATRSQTPPCPDPFEGGRLLGTLPLSGRGANEHPLGTMLGEGLDARLATDLSTLTPETLVTPSDRFFVRTSAPSGLETRMPWTIRVHGLVRNAEDLRLDSLTPRATPMGVHLMECAGNNNPANFGLMSAASWAGIPLQGLIEGAHPLPRATRVLVSGMDAPPGRSRVSQPGASWIFSLAEIERWQPFLATEMNGTPLTNVHGAPVRLLMPRWYGCASIKWVNEIEFVNDDAPSTPQMREFARRTLQDGIPERASDFKPASVDQAAMPVRVEKWLVEGSIRYRVVGIMWGGERITDTLQIGFGPDETYAPLRVCPAPVTNDTWSLWTHEWKPRAPGYYQILLRVGDRSISTRRLDLYFYIRGVRVDEV
jgi:DMSO/TMAO reductase YedYZ molybdopterin-dependent catalytic subunit